MQFQTPLLRGTLIQRYKRFLADVRLESGEVITATCPNTGSMMGLTTPGLPVWVSISDSPTRKYKHTWEMLEVNLGKGPSLVGINTNHPNALVSEAILGKRVASLKGYESLRREVKYGTNSRIDILLESPGKPPAYVEVKNVHMMREVGIAEFPDSVTARGLKHLLELSQMVREGHRAVMVFLIQRNDATRLTFARDIDPSYAGGLAEALEVGVEAIALKCALTSEGISVEKTVPIKV
ncbi:MAG: DNA/RNA nuclease SfsA [Hyphomicrobium sp.]|nr:DNA/RNA nuclease SfsA [Hyphomicrobium sp.]MBN9264901.1 DNA/RNA nuclease SfsA [Hyphomicrobium sp.]